MIDRPPSLEERQGRRLRIALALSLLLHLLLFPASRFTEMLQTPEPPEPEPITVSLLEEEPPPPVQAPETPEPEQNEKPPQRQIVDIPEQNEQPPQEPTRFEAMKDNRVEEVTKAPKIAPPENKRQEATPQPKNRYDLPAEDVAQEKAENSLAPGNQKPVQLIPSPQQIVEAIEPAQDNKLDDIEKGEITLLNTKSNPYAEYIIASARRIIRYLSINFDLTTWRRIDAAGFQQGLEVEALVDAEGGITDVVHIRRSGSPKLDRLVASATKSGLLGRRPPKGAIEADGRLHFVFILHDGWVEAGIR